MLDNIPHELRTYAQWCVWRYETKDDKLTKVPYDAKTGQLAAVDRHHTYSTFEQAVAAMQTGWWNGIGFILTDNDPFCFIDLDVKATITELELSRQISIQEKFDTYSERSPSGKGLHIICKGHVPRGRKRSSIEIYSSGRYMTVTGDVYDNKPINERQGLAEILWTEMGIGTPIYDTIQDAPQTIDDMEVLTRASNAANSAKFVQLLQGQWQELGYYSQSEGDFALIDMIAFYTQNREQIIRIFWNSALGQRDKAKRVDYMNMMVNRSFDRMLPPINFDSLRAHMDEFMYGWKGVNGTATYAVAGDTVTVPPTHGAQEGLTHSPDTTATLVISAPLSVVKFPSGLMGEISTFIFQASQRPVPEIALAAAIGLMAGMCGRAYNTPTGAGLNLYTILIALSGVGKETMAGSIARLIESIASIQTGKETVPSIRNFIGPSEFRSDAGLIKAIEEQPSMVSIQGEFGLRLRKMHAIHANSHVAGIKEVMLELYGKSGYGNVYRPIVYSDVKKNTHTIQSPAFSLLCESTPSTFYDVLDENMIAHGLLPRFLTIEYFGLRVPSNETHINAQPSPYLQAHLGQLAAYCHTIMHSNRTIYAQYANKEAYDLNKKYDVYCDAFINSTKNDTIRQLWTRTHLKTMKLASLVAIGFDAYKPLITPEIWMWAQELCDADTTRMVKRFEVGDVGGQDANELKQQDEVLRVMREFLFKPWAEISKYRAGNEAMKANHVIPGSYITRRLMTNTKFKSDRLGASYAINRVIKILLESGIIADVTGKAKFDIGGKLYMFSDLRYLKEE